jgi:DNA ligase-associated metallophosphoesterase
MRQCGLSRKHVIRLAGLDFVPDLSGALLAPDFKALIVADLHLEQGSSLARRGLHVPPYDTRTSLSQLEEVLRLAQPARLILLGDSFHDGDSAAQIEPADRRRIKAITGEFETIWISGNHDPEPPEDLGGRGAQEVLLGPVTLRHEPKPLPPGAFEIAGHLHPGASVSQRGHSIRCKCFASDRQRLIMPAFGSYTGALSLSSRAFAGLFNEDECLVWMLGRQGLHRFPRGRVT